jgi:AcrR family transcriptional regulator
VSEAKDIDAGGGPGENGPFVNTRGLFTSEARLLGKSARTRARLMDAAVAIFARDGFEAASVSEIARAADMSNGAFYVHFKDKYEIAATVAYRIAAEVARGLDAAMADVDDAAERVCHGTRRFVEIAGGEPVWGWALVRAALFLPDPHRQAMARMRADVERGARQGVFKVTIDDLLLDVLGGMMLAALAARLRGAAGPEAGARVAELQLRLLGVDAARAAEIAGRPLAPVAAAP